MRHEFKHTLNKIDDLELSGRLRKLFTHDKNAGSHGSYRVSSLYFDTPYDKAYREKIDGVDRREKFRIRYYGEDTDFIRLEKKIKIRGLCAKYTAKLSKDQFSCILDGDIDFLLKTENPLLIELYSKMKGELLRPKTIVRYDREAFIYEAGNVRVTMDRNLSTGLDCKDFLNTRRQFMDISQDFTIMEVKYDAFLPEIV